MFLHFSFDLKLVALDSKVSRSEGWRNWIWNLFDNSVTSQRHVQLLALPAQKSAFWQRSQNGLISTYSIMLMNLPNYPECYLLIVDDVYGTLALDLSGKLSVELVVV